MAFGEFEFELEFSPAYIEVNNIIPTERTTFDSIIIHDNHVKLVNPLINLRKWSNFNIRAF